jgi:biopolymer transport protein ExbD
MKLQHRRLPEEAHVNLISLVDVVLLLIIFFVLTTSFVRQSQIAVHLPEASATARVGADQPPGLEITVTQRGGFLVNGRALVDSRAETLTAAIRSVDSDTPFREAVINADARAAHQDVVTAMDVLGRLGVTDVHIATVEPRSR